MSASAVLIIVAGIFIGYEGLKHLGIGSTKTRSGGGSSTGTTGLVTGGGVSSQPGSGQVVQDIVAWSNAHAASLGIDAYTLALMLTTVSAYETGLSSSNNTGARGPFSFDDSGPGGGTYGKAVSMGYNPLTVQGSLDYFLAHDTLASVVTQIARVVTPSNQASVFHLFEQFVERPNTTVDANRVAHGDWNAAYQEALNALGTTA